MQSYVFNRLRLKDLAKKEPECMLMRACEAVTLSQLKGDFDIWCQIGMNPETKVYDTDEERQVIDFYRTDFSALMDAMFCTAKTMEDGLNSYDQHIRDYIANYYKPGEKPLYPFDFTKYFFCKTDVKSARSLLWSLLEAVVICKGELKDQLDNKDLVMSYELFLSILEAAYFIMKMAKKQSGK